MTNATPPATLNLRPSIMPADYRVTDTAGEDLWVPANSQPKQHQEIVDSYFEDGENPLYVDVESAGTVL